MAKEADRLRAVKAFRLRERRRKENKRLMFFITALAVFELLVIFIFFCIKNY